MKLLTNIGKDQKRDEWLVATTRTINNVNPIVDRLTEDESVACLIMTNKEGIPILTNISPTSAATYGLSLHSIGHLSQMYIKELDVFDEVLVTRIKTKKLEILLAPHAEFNIVVVQHTRRAKNKNKEISNNKK